MRIWWGATWKALSTGPGTWPFPENKRAIITFIIIAIINIVGCHSPPGPHLSSQRCPNLSGAWKFVCRSWHELQPGPGTSTVPHKHRSLKPPFLNKCQSPTAQPTQSQWPGRLAPCGEVLNRRSGLSRCHLAGLSKARPGFCKFRKVKRKLSAQEGLAVL